MEKRKRIIHNIEGVKKHVEPIAMHTKKFIAKSEKRLKRVPWTVWLYGGLGVIILIITAIVVWGVILQIPNINNFDTRKVVQSIEIYDRNGQKIYATGGNVNRIVVPSESISPDIKNAVIAAEDSNFYQHHGIVISSTIRAVLLSILSKLHLRSGPIQGGSTITQQVVKNTLLTQDRTIVRKMKEWILALKIEKRYSKDDILTTYLNDEPYGGTLYGVYAGAESFFNTTPDKVTLAEAAYLAAIPNAPSYYSPYGSHRTELDARKDYVLGRMKELGMITDAQYQSAKAEQVVFQDKTQQGSHAIHFVQYVMSILPDIIDQERIDQGGLKVYTTLDVDLQDKAEQIIRDHALQAEKDYNASNSGLVAIDPKTGDIIAMVGSRGYNDPNVDGKYNVTLARRQPGSSFKPFIYATAFEQGYTPDTVLFDTPTQFATQCPVASTSDTPPCYYPTDYDGQYLGPLSLRAALAQSRNIPAVKLFYMVGTQNALAKAKSMGISTLGNSDQYGLTLVLGGGEVTLLDMVSAYGTFANDGTHVTHRAITRVEDEAGNVLATVEPQSEQVLQPQAARELNDVLSDNAARTPLFGANSGLYFQGTPVAAKSGTTNNNKDAWLVGYTPNLVVGVWSGNNDNTPMKKGSSINIAPWRAFFDEAFKKIPYAPFIAPDPVSPDTKPALRGVWQGGDTFTIDTISGGLATEFTPLETRKELVATLNPHDILYWVNRSDPTGPAPINPESDSQYARFEYGAQNWIQTHGVPLALGVRPTFDDNVHTAESMPKIESFTCSYSAGTDTVSCTATITHTQQLASYTVLVNGIKALSGNSSNNTVTVSIPIHDYVDSTASSANITFTSTDVIWSKGSADTMVTLQ